MTNEAETEIPELDAPGAGLPALQEFLLKHVGFPILRRVISWDQAIALFEREGRTILTLVGEVPQAIHSKRVLVPRIMGIEDSSRYWSMAMTLDHIMIVTRGVMTLMAALSRDENMDVVVDTAQVKPATDSPGDVVQQYEGFLASFRRQLELEIKDRQGTRCHVHPWFGCLNPHGWLVMLAIHQFIHRRQVAQIRKRLIAA